VYSKCEKNLKRKGLYKENDINDFSKKCRKYETTYLHINQLNKKYREILKECKSDMKLPGSVEDKIKENPTGMSCFNEKTLAKLKEELKGHLEIESFELKEFDFGDEKYLEIFLYPRISSIRGKEEWMIIYFYDVNNKKFIGKEVGSIHFDY
jgi:hypothetical protein